MFRKLTPNTRTTTAAEALHQSSCSETSEHNKDNVDSSSRPQIQVEPRGIGPVTHLHENDVLCGRGGRINGHYGNIQFRKFCSEKREEYFAKGIKKIQKAHIAASVVERIRSLNPPGRFLKQDGSTGQWFDIGCAKAMTKVGQAIREHTPKAEEGESYNIGDISNGTIRLGQGQVRGSTQHAFNGPLYPGYNSSSTIETPQHSNSNSNNQAVIAATATTAINNSFTAPSRAINSSFNTGFYQNPVPINYAINNDTMATSNNNCMMNPTTSTVAFPPPAQQKRLSALSAMSGMSRMSALMRASVQSDFTDSMMSPPPSRRVSRADSLLRQSVLSDISDCMSVMSLDDHHGAHNNNNNGINRSDDAVGVTNDCLNMQEDMDMRLSIMSSSPLEQQQQQQQNNQPISHDEMPRMEFPNNLLQNNAGGSKISDTTDLANLKESSQQQQQQQPGRWGGRRHSRKNSLWSISMASSISLLSIGSATSFPFSQTK